MLYMAAPAGTSATSAIALLGILVTAVVAVSGYLHSARAGRRERIAHEFAEALRTVGDYQDLPFRIRRRRASDAETRAAIAERISEIHSRLDFHVAWLRVAAPDVAKTFDELVEVVRQEVGPHAKRAWLEPVISADSGMNLGLGAVYFAPRTDQLKVDCINAMSSHLRRWRMGGVSRPAPRWSRLRSGY
jgi:hypothetical protein